MKKKYLIRMEVPDSAVTMGGETIYTFKVIEAENTDEAIALYEEWSGGFAEGVTIQIIPVSVLARYVRVRDPWRRIH